MKIGASDALRRTLHLPKRTEITTCGPGFCRLEDYQKKLCAGICGLRLTDLHVVSCIDPNKELGTLYESYGKCGFCGANTTFITREIQAEELRNERMSEVLVIMSLVFHKRGDLLRYGVKICPSCGRIATIY